MNKWELRNKIVRLDRAAERSVNENKQEKIAGVKVEILSSWKGRGEGGGRGVVLFVFTFGFVSSEVRECFKRPTSMSLNALVVAGLVVRDQVPRQIETSAPEHSVASSVACRDRQTWARDRIEDCRFGWHYRNGRSGYGCSRCSERTFLAFGEEKQTVQTE